MHEHEYYSHLPSPIGELLLVSNGAALTGIFIEPHPRGPEGEATWRREDDLHRAAREQLLAYFAGERFDFDLPLAPRGTDFQQRVWRELRRIPYGSTLSYGGLALRLGQATAARAVGAANGRNPLSIIVPCHRVIGANGTLTGYGGGLERKQWLLRHETATLARCAPQDGSAGSLTLAATPAGP